MTFTKLNHVFEVYYARTIEAYILLGLSVRIQVFLVLHLYDHARHIVVACSFATFAAGLVHPVYIVALGSFGVK